MNESVLNSIKKLLGISSEDTAFDTDIIIHINTAFMILKQIGVSSEPFSITGATETWTNYLGVRTNLEAVKTYVYMKVKLAFDPPPNSSTLESFNKTITELEWRLYVETDSVEIQNGG